MQWETVIGLEVHVQLRTQSKLFSGASTKFGAAPNTQTCAIDLGMPGVLPVLNKEAVTMAVRFGLSVDAKIPEISIFARKNYFYPDLPKGYQISQHENPIVLGGHLDIQLEDDSTKRINITRAHLEEDAGKSLHEDFHGMTGIDLNRASTPLIEIVSEPDMRSATEAVAYLKTLHNLVRYLEISDANMQEGSFRCDANVSVRPLGSQTLGTRTEIKNVNSFKFIEKAINYEVARQIDVLESGDKVNQETRLYDQDKDETRTMRSKEEAEDYRYFPDPDLLPVKLSPKFIESVRTVLPELPQQKYDRFQKQYNLNAHDAKTLINDKNLADFFEATAASTKGEPKLVANWVLGELTAALNKENLRILESKISSRQLADLINRINDNTISGKIAKTVFIALWEQEGEVDAIIAAKGLKQVTDIDAISEIITEIMEKNPIQVQQYRDGKDKLFGFFVGQVMKATQGKANPEQLNQLLREKLQ